MKPHNASVRLLLDVLTNQLIPWSMTGTGMVLLDAPPKTIGNNQITERPGKVLFKKDATRYGSPVTSWHWYGENLNSLSVPYLGCVIDGEADVMVGTTSQMCRKLKMPGKEWVIQLPKKSFLIARPEVPYSAGERPHWLRPNPEKAYAHIFWMNVQDHGAECHFSTSQHGKLLSHPRTFVKGRHFLPLAQTILEEMNDERPHRASLTYLHLATLFHYMARSLGRNARHDKVDALTVFADRVPPLNRELQLQRALDYIDANMDNQTLCADSIAQHVRISVSQLNRLFHQRYAMPLMAFVWNCRLEYSQEMLLHSSHNIMQIGYRCGFAHSSSFIAAFIRKYGVSPTIFRQQNLAMKKEPNE